MIDIIALFFLCRKIGPLAIQKGQSPGRWKFYTVLAWIFAEIFGCLLIFDPNGKNDLLNLFAIGLAFAFGGYLLVHAILQKMPDVHKEEEDIKRVGVSDLQPPRKKTNL